MNANIFSMDRVMLLFKHDWLTFWKEKVVLAVVMFVSTVGVVLFGKMDYIALSVMLAMVVWLVMILAPFYFSSHILVNMRSKQDSIAFLMLPASQLEKFFVRFVDMVIVPVLIIAVSLLLGVLLDIVILGWTSVADWCRGFVEGFKFSLLNNPQSGALFEYYFENVGLIALSLIVSLVFNISKFILGGVYFGRFAIVKTALCDMALNFLIAPLQLAWIYGGNWDVDLDSGTMDVTFFSRLVPSTTHIEVTMVVEVVLTAVLMYLSYRLYTKKQVL